VARQKNNIKANHTFFAEQWQFWCVC